MAKKTKRRLVKGEGKEWNRWAVWCRNIEELANVVNTYPTKAKAKLSIAPTNKCCIPVRVMQTITIVDDVENLK